MGIEGVHHEPRPLRPPVPGVSFGAARTPDIVLMLTQTTGVHNFCVDAQSAASINHFLLNRWNRDENGFLRVGLATFAGYGDYQKVEVDK